MTFDEAIAFALTLPGTALSHRVGRDGFNDDLLHEIAGVLDEAAQKIERIK
jgi:hypothetical protein